MDTDRRASVAAMLVSDFAQWLSVLAGATTLGAVLAGPIGAVLGLMVGIGLRLGATGNFPGQRGHSGH